MLKGPISMGSQMNFWDCPQDFLTSLFNFFLVYENLFPDLKIKHEGDHFLTLAYPRGGEGVECSPKGFFVTTF